MNYIEEQCTELDSISYIFPDELTLFEVGFGVAVALDDLVYDMRNAVLSGANCSDDSENGSENGSEDSEEDSDQESDEDYVPRFQVCFEFSPNYPETAPIIHLAQTKYLTRKDTVELLSSLQSHAQECLGMAMVFTLVSYAKEEAERIVKSRLAAQEFRLEETKRIQEELEQARYRGTRVTPESFNAWKDSFIEECLTLKLAGGQLSMAMDAAASVELVKRHIVTSVKLNGRALFEKDKTLAKSDMQYAEEGDAVDLSLFENVQVDEEEEEEEENQVLRNFTEDE